MTEEGLGKWGAMNSSAIVQKILKTVRRSAM